VTGAAGGPWTVAFGGQYTGIDIPLMTIGSDTLTGGTGIHTVTHAADTVTTIECLIDVVATVYSDWVELTDAVRVPNTMMLLYGVSGDGAADPVVASVVAEFA
jgi:hypothetical protein